MKSNNDNIIQKYSGLLAQKTYDYLFLESVVEEKDKEIERLKKLLNDNEIKYEEEEGNE